MNTIYKIGIVIGIIAIYSLVTWGVSALFSFSDEDFLETTLLSWVMGLILFVVLAVFTLEKFNLWA